MPRLLYPNTYVKPGSYFKENTSTELPVLNTVQFPVVVGRGSKYIEDQEIISRGYIFQEPVSVSISYPNIFHTAYPFLKDKKQIIVYNGDSELPSNKWEILNDNTIQLNEYSVDSTYSVSYQSLSKKVKDRINLDIVKINSVGSSYASSNFEEFKHYYIEYNIHNLVKSNENSSITIAPEYVNEYDYTLLDSFSSSFNLEIDVKDLDTDINIEGKVSRVDYTDDAISFIWLQFDYWRGTRNKALTTFFKVPNDNKFHYWKGIGFKIPSDGAIIGEEITRDRYFEESREDYDTFSLKALAPKLFIENPQRKINLKVVKKGSLEHTGNVENVDSAYDQIHYYIDVYDANSKKCHCTLVTDDAFYRDETLFLVLVLSDDLGNTKYQEVACHLDGTKLYLQETTTIELPTHIKVVLYRDNPIILCAEQGEGLQGEKGAFLLVDGDDYGLRLKIDKYILSFDYIPNDAFNPTRINISNSASNSYEVVDLVNDGYFKFNGIEAYLDNDTLEENDTFEFEVSRTGYICWNLTEIVEEDNPQILTDYSGNITGNYCSKYIVLKDVYVNNLSVVADDRFDYEVLTKQEKSYLILTKNGIPYEPYGSISIRYRSYTRQPVVSKEYYVNALCNRPDSMYNSLIVVSSLDEGRKLIGPYAYNNDLYIANEIAWREFSTPLRYAYVQIKDSDNDDVISEEDVSKALDVLRNAKIATDIVLLNEFTNLLIDYNDVENSIDKQNENKIWMSLRDLDYPSQLSLLKNPQFKNVVANDLATINFVTYGYESDVRVTGIFIAWALVCVRNRIGESESILNKRINSFKEINIADDDANGDYGAHNVMFITKRGTDYIVGEDCSLESIEQIVNQQVVSVRYVREKLNESIVGNTDDSLNTTISNVQSKLIMCLNSMIDNNFISPYINEEGNKRELDASKDIFVKSISNTQIQFGYGFYTKKGIKHLFGSYVVDSTFK